MRHSRHIGPQATNTDAYRLFLFVMAAASLLGAFAIVWCAIPAVTVESITYPLGRGASQPDVSVIHPFGLTELDKKAARLRLVSVPESRSPNSLVFHVNATLFHSEYSSGLLRLYPNDCLANILVNGKSIGPARIPQGKGSCAPDFYLQTDLLPFLNPGRNTVTLIITNQHGPAGLDIIPSYSDHAVLSIAVLLWGGLYPGCQAAYHWMPRFRFWTSGRAMRRLLILFIPCFGPFYAIAVTANVEDTWLSLSHAIPILGSAIVAFLALLEALEAVSGRPFRLRFSLPWAAASVMGLAAAIPGLLHNANSPVSIMFSLAAILVGFFASVPVLPVFRQMLAVPRAVAIALLATLCTPAYFATNTALWRYLAEPTGLAVQTILRFCGILTHTGTANMHNGGNQAEFRLLISSSDNISISILAPCSGLEGVALLLFLLAVCVLFDWKLFSRCDRLWRVFLLMVPLVLTINAVRIASIVAYATWLDSLHGNEKATEAAVDAFHSNAGLFIYLGLFVSCLPVVYRWASAAVKKKPG